MGRFDNRLGAPVEISGDSPSVYVLISKIIKIRDKIQKVAVEI